MGLLSWLIGKEKGKEVAFSVDENERFGQLPLNQVIHSHMAWKQRLTDYLNDKHEGKPLDADTIADCTLCHLGQWLYKDGRQYDDYKEWVDLEQTHKDFHLCASEIVRQHNEGHTAQATQNLDGEFAKLSLDIRMNLALLYRRIRG